MAIVCGSETTDRARFLCLKVNCADLCPKDKIDFKNVLGYVDNEGRVKDYSCVMFCSDENGCCQGSDPCCSSGHRNIPKKKDLQKSKEEERKKRAKYCKYAEKIEDGCQYEWPCKAHCFEAPPCTRESGRYAETKAYPGLCPYVGKKCKHNYFLDK